MGFHAKQMFLNGWVRARILGIEWRPNSCANPATKKWKFRRLLSNKHNAAPQFFLYHMDVETFPVCSVIPIGKCTVCPFERVPKKVFLWWVPILHLHIRRSFCTVGGFFRLYNLMRSSPHTFKASRFHQGNLTKINPDPAFQTKNIFWSRISTQKNAMQWTFDPKLQCRTSARKFSALNFCIELLVKKFSALNFALNFWYKKSSLQNFNALNFCIELLAKKFNAKLQCIELLHWTFGIKVQCIELLHWTFAQKFNALNFCVELLPKSSMHWTFALNFCPKVQCIELLHWTFGIKVQCIEVLHWTFALNFWHKSSMHWTFALNFYIEVSYKISMHWTFAKTCCIKCLIKNIGLKFCTGPSRWNLKLKAQSTDFFLSFFPLKLVGKTNALFGILL